MHKYLACLFFIHICSLIYGQYIATTNSESNWIYLRYENSDIPNRKSGYLLRIEKNSIVENTEYNLVFQYELNGTHPCLPEMRPCFILEYPYKTEKSKKLIGFIRENIEDKKIYFLPNLDDKCSNIEYELYDFSMQIGDSLSYCQHNQIANTQIESSGIINDIDIESLFDLQRKTLHTTGITSYIGLNTIGDVRISEGIGFIDYGLIYGQSDLDILVDFCSSINCDIIISNKPYFVDIPFIIYPNPAADKIYIETKNEVRSISVYTINGTLININQSKTNIDVSHLERGLFIIRIDFQNNQFVNTSFFKY